VPKESKGAPPLTRLGYDPKNDALHVMMMGSDLSSARKVRVSLPHRRTGLSVPAVEKPGSQL
jgi:hypothetical protein